MPSQPSKLNERARYQHVFLLTGRRDELNNYVLIALTALLATPAATLIVICPLIFKPNLEIGAVFVVAGVTGLTVYLLDLWLIVRRGFLLVAIWYLALVALTLTYLWMAIASFTASLFG